MRKTILYDQHVSLKARMASFGGYEMPIQYPDGIIAEHAAARTGAAVFDTCHMGEFLICGTDAVESLERTLSCDVADIRVGACRYGFITDEQGGVIDDMILYRFADSEFMMVVNSGTEEDDHAWLIEKMSGNATLGIISSVTAKIDLQGPASVRIAAAILKEPIDGLRFYNFMRNSYCGSDVIVSRTGYTGEIGFEIYSNNAAAKDIWDSCIAHGAKPAGLGARDILRLEMGYPLYGHELGRGRNAAQAGFSRAISTKKEFIGSSAVKDPKAACETLRGITIDGRRTARQDDIIQNASGETIGVVTSGAFSPTLGCAIALGYVKSELSAVGTEVVVVSGKSTLTGKVAETPFHKNATARADIKKFL